MPAVASGDGGEGAPSVVGTGGIKGIVRREGDEGNEEAETDTRTKETASWKALQRERAMKDEVVVEEEEAEDAAVGEERRTKKEAKAGRTKGQGVSLRPLHFPQEMGRFE